VRYHRLGTGNREQTYTHMTTVRSGVRGWEPLRRTLASSPSAPWLWLAALVLSRGCPTTTPTACCHKTLSGGSGRLRECPSKSPLEVYTPDFAVWGFPGCPAAPSAALVTLLRCVVCDVLPGGGVVHDVAYHSHSSRRSKLHVQGSRAAGATWGHCSAFPGLHAKA
jgi:hypothetical protein